MSRPLARSRSPSLALLLLRRVGQIRKVILPQRCMGSPVPSSTSRGPNVPNEPRAVPVQRRVGSIRVMARRW